MAGIYRAFRQYASWVKNVGLLNAHHMTVHTTREIEYNHPTMLMRLEWKADAKSLQAEYDLINPEGAEISEKLYERTAHWLKRKSVTERPDVIYFDEQCVDGTKRYKMDFAPVTLENNGYIGPFLLKKEHGYLKDELVASKHNILAEGIFNEGKLEAAKRLKYFHVPEILVNGTQPVEAPTEDELYEIRQAHFSSVDKNQPLVSILIPNKDNVDVLNRCYKSIREKTTYKNYEIVIIENNSEQESTFTFYETLDAKVDSIITDWNYSHIINEGVKRCTGDYIILLNNDTEIISPDWIEQMLYYARRKEIGAVGAKLLFDDNTIQHAGVTFGIRGVAGHAFYGKNADEPGYENRICLPQNQSAVTAACLMVRRDLFDKVEGFDEKLKVNYNDVDFCQKLIAAGYQNVYTPFATLFHYESKTRGDDRLDEKKLAQQIKESRYFQKKWCRYLAKGDPYYNRNLSLDSDDFTEK